MNTTETTPTAILLTTDAEFAAAEAEFRVLMAITDPNDEQVQRSCDLHNAIVDATPRTQAQAAAVLRRLVEPGLGLRGSCSDHHPRAIERVLAFMSAPATTDTSHAPAPTVGELHRRLELLRAAFNAETNTPDSRFDQFGDDTDAIEKQIVLTQAKHLYDVKHKLSLLSEYVDGFGGSLGPLLLASIERDLVNLSRDSQPPKPQDTDPMGMLLSAVVALHRQAHPAQAAATPA